MKHSIDAQSITTLRTQGYYDALEFIIDCAAKLYRRDWEQRSHIATNINWWLNQWARESHCPILH